MTSIKASHKPRAAGRRLLMALAAITIGGSVYALLKPQVMAGLAGGTQWILEVCGFETGEGAQAPANERLRQLWYAIRMFEAPPPRELDPLDQQMAQTYPNMGFGTLRTFSQTAARVVIGDWLYSVPRTYFFDARDGRDGPADLVRLKVSVADLAPVSSERISDFLAAVSPNVLRITLAGALPDADQAAMDQARAVRKPEWDQTGYHAFAPDVAAASPYRIYETLAGPFPGQKIRCTDPAWNAPQRMPHCILRFRHAGDLEVELFFAAEHFSDWPRLRRGADSLLFSFRGRGLNQ